MSKFRVQILEYNDQSSGKYIGTYDTKETAAEEAYKFTSNNGYLSGCDKHANIIEALTTRGYYMLGYGPRDIEIEEIE